MGFFSAECRGCDHSAISIYAANGTNDWMMNLTVITPDNLIVQGTYDGYGRLDEPTLYTDPSHSPSPADALEPGQARAKIDTIAEDALDGNEVWHTACWQHSGSPTVFTAVSLHAGDQGYFFDGADYSHSEPKSPQDVAAIKRAAPNRVC